MQGFVNVIPGGELRSHMPQDPKTKKKKKKKKQNFNKFSKDFKNGPHKNILKKAKEE